MAWLRQGDTSPNHPVVLGVLEHDLADDRLLNEVFGFVVRCALLSTAHLTDYVVSHGTAIQMAGISRVKELVAVATFAGYWTEQELEENGQPRRVYKLIDDPEFIHMRTREEIEFERQRKSDNSDPALVVPVRLRDGDACRYCGMVVKFAPGARTGRHVGTYDHREPGQAATFETYVVSCKGCNTARGNKPDADERLPLLPPPIEPYYSSYTITWLQNNDWAARNGIKIPAAPRKQIKPGDPSGNGTPGQTEQPRPRDGIPGADQQALPRNGTPGAVDEPPTAHLQSSAETAGHPTTEDSGTGTGRVGTGRDGKGRGGSPAPTPPRSQLTPPDLPRVNQTRNPDPRSQRPGRNRRRRPRARPTKDPSS
jgi:5-methylcytosine-specific restriction endonuclease McrA